MTDDRFTLVRGHWYGMSMFPGYGDCPYHSPIRVDGIFPLGNRKFELRFLNLGYAAGVQDFAKELRTLRRCQSHIVADETEVRDRTYLIVHFTPSWLGTHWPATRGGRYFDDAGDPNDEALLRLVAAAY